MRYAEVGPAGARIRWAEVAGSAPVRLYLHGLGASAPAYYAGAAAHPALAGHRSLLLDFLGFGLSDRPADFGYRLTDHADTVAAVLDAEEITGAEVIAHSMGGSIAVLLAHRRPELVSRLVVVDGNLDRREPAPTGGGSRRIAHYTEDEFVRSGFAAMAEVCGPEWWATMRQADPVALHRSAVSLVRNTEPSVRELLCGLPMPRAYLSAGQERPLVGGAELVAAGVDVRIVDAGHNIMLDDPDAFAEATAAVLR
ncbi:MAG TPA: alpha/beta hydrolase [Pseudonocardiaceae bacterium]|jgi:pimeloyl-ACP methyl ester carboxylesterase|nr:alpha/beta hydrolase [Pseudonocardiaceae bacterium]